MGAEVIHPAQIGRWGPIMRPAGSGLTRLAAPSFIEKKSVYLCLERMKRRGSLGRHIAGLTETDVLAHDLGLGG